MIAVDRIANTPAAALSSSAKQALPGETGPTPFSGVLRSMVEQTQALDTQASNAVAGLLNGQGVEIHDALIATQKASLAFELALQVRNKAVAAYQQMSGMQF
jgi:flagellar hook-basal body complex protein FliE